MINVNIHYTSKLKLEIVAGYLLLAFILLFILYLVYKEREEKNAMERQEIYWRKEREMTNLTLIQLLDLAAMGELVSGWTLDDYTAYQKKRMKVTALLQNLKNKQEDNQQRKCINSICTLLIEKERLMVTLSNLLENTPDVGEMVHRKIPDIIQPTRQQKIHPHTVTTLTVSHDTKKNKNSFWNFLKKKKKKSTYALQQEKSLDVKVSQNGETASTLPKSVLDSLEKEINDTTGLYKERLDSGIDSLRGKNRQLNGRINTLIQSFEKKETETVRRKLQAQETLHNHSFLLIMETGIGGFLLIILLYMVIHKDINRQYKIRMELETLNRRNKQLSQSRQNILLTVSHDLCAPLNTINGYAELIPEEKNEAQRNRYVENILNASHHVIGLANNLLYYYRLEAGKEQPDKETFHPGRLIENVLYSFRPLADKKGLGLTTETNGVNTMVEGDRLRLTQIINNLLTNALKFTQTGYVHMSIRYSDGWLCFFVRDTGTGISEDRQKIIFKAFERLDAGDTQPGFGLGLSITAQLVSLLGGTIRVESKEGHGSTFEVCLPMPEAGKQEKEGRPKEGYARMSGLKTILIDDDRMQADMTRRMLERHGIACDCCHNMTELTERLRSELYDLLITDMQMPEVDGYGVLALLRNCNLGQSKDIPCWQ